MIYVFGLSNFARQFSQNFIEDHRYRYILRGLGNTLLISILAAMMGLALGFLIAIVRSAHDKTGKLKILNVLCKVYITIIRGTPVMVQLMIMYYVVFTSPTTSKIFVAVMAFGFNSAAYVAEIVRSGIMSIDAGQFEAGRSLGFNFFQTMCYIILPQAFKTVVPSLANEFIAVIKETSICGTITLTDLTRGGDIIRSITFDAFMPLLMVAAIYLVIVMVLTAGTNRLERRLRRNEKSL